MKTCKKGLHQFKGKQCLECQSATNAAWYKLNCEKARTYSSTRAKENPTYYTAWVSANRGKVNAHSANYKAAKLQRTPKWLTESDCIEINWAYEIASQRTLETSIPYEVDHIVPLRGKIVSGLHVPWNLQIVTKKKNRQKTIVSMV